MIWNKKNVYALKIAHLKKYVVWYIKEVWSDYHNTPDILQFLTSFCNYVFTWKQFLSIKVLVNIQHAKLSTVGIYDMKEAKNLLIHRKYHTSKIPKEIKNAFHAKIHINLTYDVYMDMAWLHYCWRIRK